MRSDDSDNEDWLCSGIDVRAVDAHKQPQPKEPKDEEDQAESVPTLMLQLEAKPQPSTAPYEDIQPAEAECRLTMSELLKLAMFQGVEDCLLSDAVDDPNPKRAVLAILSAQQGIRAIGNQASAGDAAAPTTDCLGEQMNIAEELTGEHSGRNGMDVPARTAEPWADQQELGEPAEEESNSVQRLKQGQPRKEPLDNAFENQPARDFSPDLLLHVPRSATQATKLKYQTQQKHRTVEPQRELPWQKLKRLVNSPASTNQSGFGWRQEVGSFDNGDHESTRHHTSLRDMTEPLQQRSRHLQTSFVKELAELSAAEKTKAAALSSAEGEWAAAIWRPGWESDLEARAKATTAERESTLSVRAEAGRAALLQCLLSRRMAAGLWMEAWQRLAMILASAMEQAVAADQLDVAVQMLEIAGVYVLADDVNIWGVPAEVCAGGGDSCVGWPVRWHPAISSHWIFHGQPIRAHVSTPPMSKANNDMPAEDEDDTSARLWECAFFRRFSAQSAGRAAMGDLFSKPAALMKEDEVEAEQQVEGNIALRALSSTVKMMAELGVPRLLATDLCTKLDSIGLLPSTAADELDVTDMNSRAHSAGGLAVAQEVVDAQYSENASCLARRRSVLAAACRVGPANGVFGTATNDGTGGETTPGGSEGGWLRRRIDRLVEAEQAARERAAAANAERAAAEQVAARNHAEIESLREELADQDRRWSQVVELMQSELKNLRRQAGEAADENRSVSTSSSKVSRKNR